MGQVHGASESHDVRLYDDEGELLMSAAQAGDHVTLLPPGFAREDHHERLRIMWGQDMLRDVISGRRYRAVVCGVNTEDNSHGIISQIANMTTASQWTADSITSFAKMFEQSVGIHAKNDREPYILKYDLDSVLVLALLRPKGHDLTLENLSRGFQTVTKMLKGRRERLPVASVSFLGARSNRLVDERTGAEPSFEGVLRTMFEAGFRGDVYPSPQMWQHGDVGVFPSYPFPEGLERMRAGGF